MIIDAKGINKCYREFKREVHVLKDVSLQVQEGEVVSIVGPSGAGKSTLLHILGGLDKPDTGSVLFDGEEFYKHNDVKRAKVRNNKIGFIFQFYHLLGEFTALENVVLPAMIQADTSQPKQFEAKAKELLDKVGLKDRIEHKPQQLSGGEQQRVAIARALINEPKIILCDEPTGNLDSENGQEIIDLLMGLNHNNGQTLLMVTHDQTLADVSSRTVHMKDGKLIKETVVN